MSDKKLQARKEMLKKLARDKSSSVSDSFGEALKGKKLSKVEVVADSKDGLKKGLSKAQEILKAKYGEDALEGDKVDESEDESMEEDCAECHDEGCELCEEKSEEIE